MTLCGLSLFSGIGGLDLAFERAGVEIIVDVEIDRAARGVLAQHWPGGRSRFSDVREVSGDDCRAAGFVAERGLLVAGFPCQDLSIAGRRLGMGHGTRSGLFWHVARLLAEAHPRWVVLENVPGLLSAVCCCRGDGSCTANGRADVACRGEQHTVSGGACAGGCLAAHGGSLGTVLGSLAELGYGFAYRVLDAQHFGVAQRRRRVFIVGCLGDDGRAPVSVLFEHAGGAGDSAARPSTWQDDRRPARGGADAGREAVNALTSHQGGADDNDAQAGRLVAFRKSARVNVPGSPERWVDDDIANTLNAFDTGPGHETTIILQRGDGSGAAEGHFAHTVAIETRQSRWVGSEVAGTITARDRKSATTLLLDQQVRRLTPLECERLQGLPDGWTALSDGRMQSDSRRYTQIGNSVAVPCAEWVARRLVAVDEGAA